MSSPSVHRKSSSSSKYTRSPTAIAGINLLKNGCEAVKFTRSGKPRTTKFRLSDDEQTLSWDSGTRALSAPVKIARGERRHIKITEILEIMLGMESKIFSLHKNNPGSNHQPMAHLSMTLVLIGSVYTLRSKDAPPHAVPAAPHALLLAHPHTPLHAQPDPPNPPLAARHAQLDPPDTPLTPSLAPTRPSAHTPIPHRTLLTPHQLRAICRSLPSFPGEEKVSET